MPVELSLCVGRTRMRPFLVDCDVPSTDCEFYVVEGVVRREILK